MPNQSLQNDSGKLNVTVRDNGTANIYSNVSTIRFKPEGCLTFGPSGREVTVNTASTGGGGGGVSPGDVLWEVGTGTNSIKAKNAGTNTTAGNRAVSHGNNNKADADDSYTGGGQSNSVNAGATNAAVIGGSGNTVDANSTGAAVIGGATNTVSSNADDSVIVGGNGNTVNSDKNAVIAGTTNNVGGGSPENTVIIGGSGNITSGTNNTVLAGMTGLTTTQASTVHVQNLEVGNRTTVAIGGIKRISTVVAESWEDGNSGNSTELWFTPSELTGVDASGIASATGLTDTTAAGYIPFAPPGPGPGAWTQLANGFLSSTKLLPKGFHATDQATFYFAGIPAWCGDVAVYQCDISTNSYRLLGQLGGPPVAAVQVVPFSTSPSATGTGSRMIMIHITIVAGVRANQSFLGSSISMSRI